MPTLFNIYWSIVIIILPIYHRSITLDSRVYKDIFFLIAGIGSLAMFDNRPKFSWMIFCLVVVFYSSAKINVYAYGNSFFQAICLLTGLALISQFSTNWNHRTSKFLSNAFIAAAIIQCIWIFSQYLGYEPATRLFGIRRVLAGTNITDGGKWITEGSLDNRMVTACYLSALFPFFLVRKWVLLIPVILGALFLLESAMGFFSIFVCLSYLFIDKIVKWKLPLVLLTFIFLGMILTSSIYFFPDFFTSSGRYEAWLESLRLSGFTWTGYGQGSFHAYAWKYIKAMSGLRHAHNEYVQFYFTYGLLGLAVVIPVFYGMLKNHRKYQVFTMSVLSILASSVGAFPLYISSSALIFIVGSGALLSRNNPKEGFL